LVTIIVAMATLAGVYASLSSRIAVLESGAQRAMQDVAEIKDSIRELNRKLDQMLMAQREQQRQH